MLRSTNSRPGRAPSGRKRSAKQNPPNTPNETSKINDEGGDTASASALSNPVQSPIQTVQVFDSSSVRPSLPSSSSIPPMSVRNMGGGSLKFAKDLIPEFNGLNMSVMMFIEQCNAAAALLEPHEIPYLVIIIRNKVIAPARSHIQDNFGIGLGDILRILKRTYMPREDTSQLTQDLVNICRYPNETSHDYGTRVTVLLNKIVSNVMENNPNEKGRERCEEYTENAIKNFVRGLDKETLNFMKDKSPTSLVERFSRNWDLNSGKRRQNGAVSTPNQMDRSRNVYSSASEEQMENSKTQQ